MQGQNINININGTKVSYNANLKNDENDTIKVFSTSSIYTATTCNDEIVSLLTF